MKALSIRQPWAWMVASGLKTVENRSRMTNFRGRFLIHSSQKIDLPEGLYNEMRADYHEIGVEIPPYDQLFAGGIIGAADIVGSTFAPEDETDQDWHEDGMCAWIVRNPEVLPFQPLKGKLNFFDVN